jgi:uncharacterized protein YjdB
MKKTLKLMANMLAIATFALVIISCNEDETDNTASAKGEVKSVKVEPTRLYLEVDAKQTLTVTLEPADASSDSIIWSSYNRDIATVRSTGGLTAEVTGVSIGTTVITIVTSNDKRATCEVTVSKTIPLVAITLSPDIDSLHLEPGETRDIIAIQGPANATNYRPAWTSSNPEAVIVEGGLITAVAMGKSTVTVTSGEISRSVEVVVTDPLSSITIEPGELLHLKEIGNTQQLTAVPVPEVSRNYNPVWTSTNPDVATVKDGLVTAVGLGTAVIIVTSGNIADSVDVKVTSAYLSDIIISPAAGTDVFISTGEEIQIDVTPLPETAENYVLTFNSNNPGVATVSNEGLIHGVSYGIATVTVSSGDIEKSITVLVNIVKYSTEGWTATSRNGNHNWQGDGGDVDGAGQPWCVLDGDKTTGWHSRVGAPLPQCMVVDMKSLKDIHRLVIWHVTDGLRYQWLYYKTIEIYLSNDPVAPDERQASWGEPVGVHNYTGGYDPVIINLTPNSQGQYLILYFPDSTNNTFISFGELDVY